jgi:excisionase family DNA binding protein
MPAEPIFPIRPTPDPAPSVEALRDRPEAVGLEPLLTPREAAALLRMSESWLWQATRRGDVRCVRIGRAVRYDRRDLAEFVDRLRAAGSARPAPKGGGR